MKGAIWGERGAVAASYGILGVPSLILLDESGRIAGGQRLMDQSLEKMFKGNPSR